MKGKYQVKGSAGPDIEPGTYPATLEKATAWTNNKYQSNEIEPMLNVVWNLGEDDEGNDIRVFDNFLRITRDKQGWPVLNDASKLYNRLSAAYGTRFDTEDPTLDWELVLPGEYDDPEGLMALPHYSERSQEGFRPVEVKSILINGTECIGKEAQVTLVKNGDYTNVKEASPVPRKANFKRPVKPAESEEEEESLPV